MNLIDDVTDIFNFKNKRISLLCFVQSQFIVVYLMEQHIALYRTFFLRCKLLFLFLFYLCVKNLDWLSVGWSVFFYSVLFGRPIVTTMLVFPSLHNKTSVRTVFMLAKSSSINIEKSLSRTHTQRARASSRFASHTVSPAYGSRIVLCFSQFYVCLLACFARQ